MESKRQQKISRLIQKELALLFQRELSKLFSNTLLSVNIVRITPDLGFAKVYVSVINGGDEVFEKLEIENKRIRHELAKKIRNQVRTIPELTFFKDDTIEYANKINKILSDLNIPPADENEDKKD